jgi:hypothetical protein
MSNADKSAKININASEITAAELYTKGRQLEIEEHASLEHTKDGTLRGGSSGCLTAQGEVYGTCHRKAFARFKGHQPEIDDISYTWFDAGYANEDAWKKKLDKSVVALGPEYILKEEEECPVTWEVNGVKVTGRPDFMVFKQKNPYEELALTEEEMTPEPILGLELKVVCAVNSAIGIYCEDKPKIANLIQAAHYSMEHGCPFNLVYSFRGRSIAPGWASKFKDKLTVKEKTFPPYRRKDGTYGKPFTKREYIMEPFLKEFRIGFEDDTVYYITDSGEKVITPLTAKGIRDYYEMITNMEKNMDLHVRISKLDLEGNLLPYDPCGFCPFSDICDDYENDFVQWLDRVKLLCEGDK